MTDAAWLDRWLPLLAQHGAGRPVLELGCGSGLDTARLAAAGHAVVAIDRDAAAVAKARERAPSARIETQDLLGPWPLAEGGCGAIVARLQRALGPRGLLLCRLNSTHDRHFGASGHPAIDENYFDVDGAPKRFFDRVTIDRLFGPAWQVLSLEETTIDRYEQPKVVWELAAAV